MIASLLVLSALQTDDGPMTLTVTREEAGGCILVSFAAEADIADGVQMTARLYYDSGAAVDALGRLHTVFKGGRIGGQIQVGDLPMLPGRYRIEIRPRSTQPDDLPLSVRRILHTLSAEGSTMVGTDEEALNARRRLSDDLKRQLSGMVEAIDRLSQDYARARTRYSAAEWAVSLQRSIDLQTQEATSARSQRAYALFGFDAMVAVAFEDMVGISNAVRQHMSESLASGNDDPQIEASINRLLQVHVAYFLELDGQTRNVQRLRETIGKLRRCLTQPIPESGELPAEVAQLLLETCWQMPGGAFEVTELTDLYARHFRGKATAAIIEAQLDALESQLSGSEPDPSDRDHGHPHE